ncbi:MAG: tetratricopeptide repeat protein [Candidatus Fermentibacteria bacterium]|nr:tetratricopeptide repeat protein [Candidatus Fermentibacteria bacterium]
MTKGDNRKYRHHGGMGSMVDVGKLQAKLTELRSVADSRPDLARTLNQLASVEYRDNPDKAKRHAEEALSLARDLGLDDVIAESQLLYGTSCWITGNFGEAMEYYLSSLEIWKRTGNDQGTARVYNNIGNIHRGQASYSKALEYYLKSLEVKNDLGDRRGTAASYLNIGNIYKQLDLPERAQESYSSALVIYEENHDELNMAKCYNNIGLIHSLRSNHLIALEQHKQAMAIRERINDTRGIAHSYGNIGSVYQALANYEKALEYFQKTLMETEKLQDIRGIGASCNNIGSVYIKVGEFDKALIFLDRAYRIATDSGAKDLEFTSLQLFSELYEAKKDFKQALDYSKKYLKIQEELFSQESRDKIATLQVRYDTERKCKEAEIFREKNMELEKEISERLKAELELKEHRKHLEDIVQDRTAELLKVNAGLEKSFMGTIFTISKIIEMRDPYAKGHQLRTAELARSIAVEMELPEERIQAVYLASTVHDIGKIRIPQEFLSKSGKLSELELNVLRTYPQAGYDILKTIEFPWPIADIVLQHHEFLDGSGYPSGLKGREIMQESKILCVADVVEAMSSSRPYRAAFPLEEILDELMRNRGVLYDSECVDAGVSVLRKDIFTPKNSVPDSYTLDG